MSRKAMTTTLNQELIKKAKKLAIDRNKNLNDLIEEGLMIILNKYAKNNARLRPGEAHQRLLSAKDDVPSIGITAPSDSPDRRGSFEGSS